MAPGRLGRATMIPNMIELIRRAIARGMSNEAISEMLDVLDTDGNMTAPGTPERKAAIARNTVRSTSATVPATAFVKPDQTRTIYRMAVRKRDGQTWRDVLDRRNVVGNLRVVAEYIAENNASGVDSRLIRQHCLTHKLRSDGVNKAVESAIDQLKRRGIIKRADKPIDHTYRGNAVPLPDDE